MFSFSLFSFNNLKFKVEIRTLLRSVFYRFVDLLIRQVLLQEISSEFPLIMLSDVYSLLTKQALIDYCLSQSRERKTFRRGGNFLLIVKNLLRIATVHHFSPKKQCESIKTMKKVFTKRESNLMSLVLCNRKIVYLCLFLVFAAECFSETVVDEGSNLNLRCSVDESQNGELCFVLFWLLVALLFLLRQGVSSIVTKNVSEISLIVDNLD